MPYELKVETESMLLKKFDEVMGKYYETPDLLYHYTNVNGLVGIIESQKIWATDCRFLNDSSEILYGAKLVKEILNKKMMSEKKDVVLEFMRRSQNIDVLLFGLFDIYITCFCEEGNLLGQWRGYGDKGDGYSLGIEMERIKNSQYKIGRIIYSREEQESIINNILDLHCELIRELAREKDIKETNLLIADFAIKFSALISQVICLFKHPAFAEEREWRLIRFLSKYESSLGKMKQADYLNEVKFRNNSEFLIPYTEITLATTESNNLIPVRKVIYGPSKQPNLKKIALEQFMKKDKYSDVEIVDSNIPFRR